MVSDLVDRDNWPAEVVLISIAALILLGLPSRLRALLESFIFTFTVAPGAIVTFLVTSLMRFFVRVARLPAMRA